MIISYYMQFHSVLNELITTLFNFELSARCVIARNWHIICYNINMIM